jgi:hypothetical protein
MLSKGASSSFAETILASGTVQLPTALALFRGVVADGTSWLGKAQTSGAVQLPTALQQGMAKVRKDDGTFPDDTLPTDVIAGLTKSFSAATHEHHAGEFSMNGFGAKWPKSTAYLTDTAQMHSMDGHSKDAKDTHVLARHVSNGDFKAADAHFGKMSKNAKDEASEGLGNKVMGHMPSMMSHVS